MKRTGSRVARSNQLDGSVKPVGKQRPADAPRAPRRQTAQPVRLQKVLADAGVASRRAAERLIAEGHVTVNGAAVTTLGSTVVAGRDRVAVDGQPVQPPQQRVYLLLNKPPGYVTTVRDPHAERTVMALVPRAAGRVYPVGRLDRDSEGLLLLTDDGELAERLMHPRYEVEREYAVLVRGVVAPGTLAKLREGIDVDGARVVPVTVVKRLPPPPIARSAPPGSQWLRITLREGRRHEVRVMCAAVHLHVLRLMRVRLGPLHLGDLAAGTVRPLTEEERTELRRTAGLAVPPTPKAKRTAPPTDRPPKRRAAPVRGQRASSSGKRPSKRALSNS